MKHKIYLCLMFLCLCTSLMAQTAVKDRELSALVDVVRMLRVSSEANFNKARDILAKDQKWTMMDETGAVRDNECKASEKVDRFKLNKILSKVSGSRKHVSTHGDMVNGQSTAYNYSLYERALKPNKEVRYTLKGREGRQTFVLLPYNPAAKLEVSIYCNKKKVSDKPVTTDGMVVVEWTKNTPSKTQNFELVIKNATSDPQSFVVLNHNTRKK